MNNREHAERFIDEMYARGVRVFTAVVTIAGDEFRTEDLLQANLIRYRTAGDEIIVED